jgi:hypothetical protein
LLCKLLVPSLKPLPEKSPENSRVELRERELKLAHILVEGGALRI